MKLSDLHLTDSDMWELDNFLFKNCSWDEYDMTHRHEGGEVPDPNGKLRNSLIYHILKRIPHYSRAFINNASAFGYMKDPMGLEEARINCDLLGYPHQKCEKYLLFVMTNANIANEYLDVDEVR